MTTEHSLVTYGNGDNLREVFNAIAAAMNSDSAYSNLIHLAIGLAGAWAMLDGSGRLTQFDRASAWVCLFLPGILCCFSPQGYG